LKTLLVAKGLHPPWATGEVSYTRGLLESLSLIHGNEISVIYTIDNHRITNARTNDEDSKQYFETLKIANCEEIRGNTAQKVKAGALRSILRALEHERFDAVHVAYQGMTPFEITKNLDHNNTVVTKHIYGPSPSLLASIKTKIAYSVGFAFRLRQKKILISFPSSYSAKTYWMKSSRYTVLIPPAIDTNRFIPQRKIDLEVLFSSCLKNSSFSFGFENLAKSTRVIAYIGWLISQRFPHEIVLRSFRKLLERYPRSYMLILGRQSERFYGESKMAESIVSFARKIGIEKKIGIALLELSQFEKLALINSADLMIYPFATSHLNPPVVDPPLAILESMSCGKPVLTTGILSIPEIIQNGVNGFILKRLTLDDLTDGLMKAVESGDCVGQKARETILSRFSLETIAGKLEHL
jgi:glycosyltransferase involved in cell wall biosynthesis